MPKSVNCCGPGCFNNFKNSSDLHYYRIQKDRTIRKEYVRLTRNQTLKIDSENTRTKRGKKNDRQQLSSVVPSSKKIVERRLLKRILTKEYTVILEKVMRLNNEEETSKESVVRSQENETSKKVNTTSVGTQTDICVETCSVVIQTDPLKDIQERIKQLEKEICELRDKFENARFDIDEFKHSPKDIAFFTGFADNETLLLCFDILKESVENLSYGYVGMGDDENLVFIKSTSLC